MNGKCIFSHSNADDNYKWNGFDFNTGDEITVTFDPNRHKLIFTKGGSDLQQFELNIGNIQATKEPVNFFVNLFSMDDDVSIL
jgi:hypothetical protein